MKTQTLLSILDRHAVGVKSIDFMSVDCEGVDIQVLKSNDWEKYRPRVIAVEDHDVSMDTAVCRLMNELDYELRSWACITKIFIDKRIKEEAKA